MTVAATLLIGTLFALIIIGGLYDVDRWREECEREELLDALWDEAA